MVRGCSSQNYLSLVSCLRNKGRNGHAQDKKIPFQYHPVDTGALVIPLPNALQRGWLLSLGWDEHTHSAPSAAQNHSDEQV